MNGSLDADRPFSDMVSRYADMLVRVGYTYMKNLHDAEDIAQEAFLKLFEKDPAFENEDHRKAWLLRVVMNLSVNRLRSSWLKKKYPLEERDIPFTAEENTVMDAVQQLPVKYRVIIHLYYIEGYSISEIGSLLGRKDSTVGSQMHRARAMLRRKLEEDFDV